MDNTYWVYLQGLALGQEWTSPSFKDSRQNTWRLKFARASSGISISLLSDRMNCSGLSDRNNCSEIDVILRINRECVLDDWFIYQSNMSRYLHTTQFDTIELNLRTEYLSTNEVKPSAPPIDGVTLHRIKVTKLPPPESSQ